MSIPYYTLATQNIATASPRHLVGRAFALVPISTEKKPESKVNVLSMVIKIASAWVALPWPVAAVLFTW